MAFGAAAGFLAALLLGIYVIYADMLSRVTFVDPDQPQPLLLVNLLEEDLGSPEDWVPDSFMQSGHLPEMIDDSIPRETEAAGSASGFQAVNVPMQQMPGVDNILIFGVDTHSYSGRADAIILLSINHNTKTINIVSLMRAMYVRIGLANREWGLLNAAYSYGGANLAVRTVERNFGIPIKGFAAVNFSSFPRIIDALGGVTITLTQREADYMGMRPGTHRLDGKRALYYARIRKIDSDFQRNQRQRNIINSILGEMASQSGTAAYKAATVILANTYTNLDLNSYLLKAPSYLSYRRRQLQLPASGEMAMRYVGGQEVWWFDMLKTHTRLVSFLTN